MEARRWTMDELVELVRGCEVDARDAQARRVPLPAEMARVATIDDRTGRDPVNEARATGYTEVIEAWTRAINDPGEVYVANQRRLIDDRWYDVVVRTLSLLEQPELGLVLVIASVTGETATPDGISDEDRAVYTAPACFVQYLDQHALVLRTEGDVERAFGEPAEALVGRSASEFLHPDDHGAAVSMWLELMASPNNSRTIQQRVVRPDDTTMWVQTVMLNRLDSVGVVQAVSYDISTQREQQLALAASEEQLRFLTEAVPVAVFRLSGSGDVAFANARWSSLLGEASSFDQVLAATGADDRGMLARAYEHAQSARVSASATVRMGCGRRHLEFRLQGVGGSERSDPGYGVIGTVDDVTSEVLRTFHLEATADLDPLTALANRRGLTRKLEAALASPGATLVIFGDLDGFKRVNDEWGHAAGDDVLIEIGERLSAVVRPEDLVGRWGGDEFVIVCDHVPDGDEDHVVTRLQDALSTEILADGHPYRARVSLGVVRPRPGEVGEDLLRRADTAMYEAKRARHKR